MLNMRWKPYSILRRGQEMAVANAYLHHTSEGIDEFPPIVAMHGIACRRRHAGCSKEQRLRQGFCKRRLMRGFEGDYRHYGNPALRFVSFKLYAPYLTRVHPLFGLITRIRTMERKPVDMHAFGMMLLVCISLGLQQVLLKMTAADISPLFQIAL